MPSTFSRGSPWLWFRFACLLALAAVLHAGSARAQPDSGEYRILQARYGTEERNVDVTARLRELARGDQRFRLSNEVMGGDPDPGRVKALRIHARQSTGQIRTFEYDEGSIVDGALFVGWRGGDWGQPGEGRDGRDGRDGRGQGGDGSWQGGWGRPGTADDGEFHILRALYGTPERHADVTARLRELARSDRRFRLGNDSFGGTDPDAGRRKTLRVFAIGPNRQQRTFDYAEGSWVDGTQFSGWGGGGWEGSGPPVGAPIGRGLVIVGASYGNGPRVVDVTMRLRQQVQGGRLVFVASNDSAGYDPAPQTPKVLTVTYRIDGGPEQRRVVNEGQVLSLP